MKKISAVLLSAAMLLTLAAGCAGQNAQGSGEVNVYNWGEYINMDVLAEFKEQTGITVNYKTFPNNEYMYSSLQTGGYDVIIPSDYMVSRLIEEDLLEKLDFGNIPNFSLVSDQYKNLDFDPENAYSVPYTWGTVGIIYNPNMVEEPVDSWDILWDARYAGQILQFDNPRDAAATALFRLGYSLNTTDEAQLREAFALLAEQKPLLQKYVDDQIYDLMEVGEAAIGPYYAGDYLMMLENNPDLRFVVPNEGTNFFVDAMCIPKGAKNKANAEAFINFMLATETCISNMNETGYASPNDAANTEYAADYDLSDPEDAYQYGIMFPDAEHLAGYQTYIHLPASVNQLYSELWSTLKS